MASAAGNAIGEAIKGMTDDELSALEQSLNEDRAKREREAYLATSSGKHLQAFVDGVADSVDTVATPTGFDALDEALGGGLFEGLICLAGISSVGKTSFLLQVADNVAASGKSVLYYALEMAESEMQSKSISRHTLTLAMERHMPTAYAKTSRGITTGARYLNYSQEEKQLIADAVTEYARYADNLYFVAPETGIDVEQIGARIAKHISLTGERSIVFVDYLQLLQPANERASDKTNVDNSIYALKRITRTYKVPIVCASSYSRSNYRQEASLSVYKESGSVEYSCDLCLALQLQGVGLDGYDEMQSKNKDPRQVELCILKNRQGPAGQRLLLSYYPRFSYFRMESKPTGKGV